MVVISSTFSTSTWSK